MSTNDITTVSIPSPLAEKLRKRIEGTGFKSLSSYVTYILRQVASGIEMDEQKKKEAFSEEDEKKVKDRLRGLGYLE